MAKGKLAKKALKSSAPQPRPAPKKRAAPKRRVPPPRAMDFRPAMDARVGLHVPTHAPSGPYTVVRDLTRTSITVGSHQVVAIFGAYQTDYHAGSGGSNNGTPTPNYCPVIGYVSDVNNAATAPQNWLQIESGWADTRCVNTNDASPNTVGLHAMTISVQNSKGTANAEGFVYIGNLTTPPARASFINASTLATNLLRRKEMRRHSAVELSTRAEEIALHPSDMTNWSSFDPLFLPGRSGVGFNDTLLNRSRDTLSHVALVFTPSGGQANTYSIEITTEWRVMYGNDTELASTHATHSATPVGIWSQLQKQAQAVEGRLARGAGGWARAAERVLGGAANGLGRNSGRFLGLAARAIR